LVLAFEEGVFLGGDEKLLFKLGDSGGVGGRAPVKSLKDAAKPNGSAEQPWEQCLR
jgi:hypothetical protein